MNTRSINSGNSRSNTDFSDAIRKDSPLPYYAQLRAALLKRIEAGEWQPLGRLPSEAEICEQYQVSRTVVRQTLAQLEREGTLTRERGRGSFLSQKKIPRSLFQELIGFYEESVRLGIPPTTKVLEQKMVEAGRELASVMGLAEDAKVLKLVRLRGIQNVPVVYSTTYVPQPIADALVDYDFTDKSFYESIEHDIGLAIGHGFRSIEVKDADDEEAEILELRSEHALMIVETKTYLEDGRLLEFSIAKHRGDRSRFEVHLYRAHPPTSLDTQPIRKENSNLFAETSEE